MSSLRDENFQKKIGCMNGIFQFFDLHHINGYSSKRLLQGGKHQMDQQHAKKSVMEEKPRISNDSSRASFSSSSCSSTFSSLDFNRTIQPETTAASNRSHDLRDVVKESMHREVRSLSIKPHNSGERRGTVMKHIDSPRPSKHSNVANELLTLHRFSYDGRESREANRAAMKMKELPRLSLDSKTNSVKALESRLNEEPGSHNRRSSVVARLMGLEALPDATSTDERRSPPSQLSLKTDEHKQNQANYSPRVSPNNSIKKATASSGQQDSSQESPKLASKSRKGAADALHQTSSVYGQIKKRITELEFNKSGKDLRALKQIIESMEEKTTARTADQHAELTSRRRCSLEESCPHQNTRDFHQAKLRTPTPKIHSKKVQNLTPKSRNAKTHYQHVASTDKKGNLELDKALKTTRRMKLEACTTPCRSPAAVSPRLQQNPLRIEAEPGRMKMQHGSKKHTEKGSQSRKNRVKAKETEVITLAYSINTNTRLDKNLVSITREQMPAVGSDVTILEQPSPISVLDNTFYSEDPPSPVKKISSAFQVGPSRDEAERCLQNHVIDCTRLNQSFKYNQKFEDMKRSVQELIQMNKEPNRTASNHNESLNPAHRYINKILLTSGLLKDSSFISTTDKIFSSSRLINPEIFLVLEQTEDIRDVANGAVIEKNDKINLDKALQRKMVFDLVDEILVRKITSSRLFTKGKKKQTSPEGLLKEVLLEMDRLCKAPDCNLEENETTRLFAADINYQSEDWVDCSGEVPSMALDVERQIFKDLINEVITGELMDGRDWPNRHSRKLFGK